MSFINAAKKSRFAFARSNESEHARGDRRRADALLVGPGLGRLREVEPFEFETAHRFEAELLGALQHALQHLPAIERERHLAAVLLHYEFAEEEIDVVVPRHAAVRRQVEARQRVRKALVPAGQRRVVVANVLGVPPEDDIAETEATLDGRHEFVLVDVLAAQNAVDVGHGDLDTVSRRLAHGGDDFCGRGRSRHAKLPKRSCCCRREVAVRAIRAF
jgi:hypothetical protein